MTLKSNADTVESHFVNHLAHAQETKKLENKVLKSVLQMLS